MIAAIVLIGIAVIGFAVIMIRTPHQLKVFNKPKPEPEEPLEIEFTPSWPEDDELTMYIEAGAHLSDVLNMIKEKWPDKEPNEILITSELIQVSGNYPCMDMADYQEFLVVCV